MKKLLLAGLMASMLTGCASVPLPQDKSPTTKTFDLTYDETWNGLVEALAKTNSTISNIAKDSGLITVETLDRGVDSKYIECKIAPFGTTSKKVTGKISFFVKKAGDGKTRVDITTARELNGTFNLLLGGTANFSHECVSNGKYEELIYNFIEISAKNTGLKIALPENK